MKKLFFVLLLCSAVSCLLVSAQDAETKSGYYYVNVPIVMIYPYAKGYVVTYNTGVLSDGLATIYLPQAWFAPGKDNRGTIVNLKQGTVKPSFSVIYKDGAFDHVKLYVKKDRKDSSWGYMPLSVNIDDRFENVTDIKIEY
ncbi:MAG: hypothetical protein LBH75_02510 [Treponema sp.]|jgi:hypothetical protein|nr:hypothetical protein [Treponema sp.]